MAKTVKTKHTLRNILLALLVVLLAAGVGVAYILSPPDKVGSEVNFTIEEGSSLTGISNTLEEAGMVRSALAFKVYVKLKGDAGSLKAGNYIMNTDWSAADILRELISGQEKDTVVITVREGLDLNRIGSYLEEAGLFTKAEFLDEIKNNFSWYAERYSFLADVPAEREYKLEGYLFGDTYYVYADSSPRDVIVKMLDGFEDIFTDQYYERIRELGISIDEAVIMASIVERECIAEAELPIVASVFYNRIREGMLLQSCATLQYIYKDYQYTFTKAQINSTNPYNTYKYIGLPPGPIANFRRSALEAALYPADTNYFYFCAKGDNSGESAFAETLSQHEANVAKYSGNWE